MKHYIFFLITFIYSQFFFNNTFGQSLSSYNESGILKYMKGDYQGAILDYNKVIQHLSDTADLNPIKQFELIFICGGAYVNRGNAKTQLKDYRGAVLDYTKSIQLHALEEYEHPYFNRGIAKGNLGDFQGALKDFDKSIDLYADFPDVYYVRGNAKAQLGDMDSACLDWSKAGELGYSKAYERIKANCN